MYVAVAGVKLVTHQNWGVVNFPRNNVGQKNFNWWVVLIASVYRDHSRIMAMERHAHVCKLLLIDLVPIGDESRA